MAPTAGAAPATAQLASFETGHGDMVHDAAFDYYGKRLATCSSDRLVKVFDVVGDASRWQGFDAPGEQQVRRRAHAVML